MRNFNIQIERPIQNSAEMHEINFILMNSKNYKNIAEFYNMLKYNLTSLEAGRGGSHIYINSRITKQRILILTEI